MLFRSLELAEESEQNCEISVAGLPGDDENVRDVLPLPVGPDTRVRPRGNVMSISCSASLHSGPEECHAREARWKARFKVERWRVEG